MKGLTVSITYIPAWICIRTVLYPLHRVPRKSTEVSFASGRPTYVPIVNMENHNNFFFQVHDT